MIKGYIKPQLKIRQMLERVPDVPQTVLSPMVIGPRYKLYRYTRPTEREKMAGTEFEHVLAETPSEWQALEYEGKSDEGIVDTGYVRLFAENLEAGVAEISLEGDYTIKLRDSNPNQLEVTDSSGNPVNVGVAGLDLAGFLDSRPLAVGDAVYLKAAGTDVTTKRVITGFRGAKVTATHGFVAANGDFVPDAAGNSVTNVKATTAVAPEFVSNPDYMTAVAYEAAGWWSGIKTGASIGATSGTQQFGEVYTFTCINTGDTPDKSLWEIRSTKSGTAQTNLILGGAATNWAFAHPVLSGAIINVTVEVGSTPTVNDRFVVRILEDFDPVAPEQFAVSGAYTGKRDTTYVITVVGGSDTDLYKPFTIASITDASTAQTEADASQVFSGRPAYIPGKHATLLLSRDAAGVITSLGVDLTVVATPGDVVYVVAANDDAQPANRSWCDGAVLSITDTSGIDTATKVTLTSDEAGDCIPFNVGTLGLQGTVDDSIIAPKQRGLRKGDVYYVEAKAEADTGVLSTIVLSGRAAETEGWSTDELSNKEFSADFRTLFTGEVPVHSDLPGEQFQPEEDSVLLRNNLKVPVSGYAEGIVYKEALGRMVRNGAGDLLPYKGRLFVHYREFIPAEPGTEIKLYSVVPSEAGEIDLENPFAYGLSRALSGAQGRPVYAAPVEEESVSGYEKLLKQAMNIEGVYAIAPMTADAAIQKAVADHVIAASTEGRKMWRRAYISTESPGSYARLTESNGQAVTAQILSHEDGFVRVVSENGDFVTKNVQPNDILRVNFSTNIWGDPEYDEYLVKAVMDDTELLLQSGPENPVSPATKIEIWAPDTARTQAEFVAAKARNFGSRRVMNVWAERPLVITLDGQIKTCPVMYAAAEVAGLRCALFPQQGLTRTEILTFAGINAMYAKYTEEDLDLAAAGGTCIITQEKPGGEIFIRHQITTDTVNGILYYEDNVGVIVDELSYRLKNVMTQYVGRRNSDDRTLQEIKTQFRSILLERMSAPFGQERVGAALAGYSDLFVQRDRYNVSTVNSGVKVQVPTAINVLDISIAASTIADDVNIEADLQDA